MAPTGKSVHANFNMTWPIKSDLLIDNDPYCFQSSVKYMNPSDVIYVLLELNCDLMHSNQNCS